MDARPLYTCAMNRDLFGRLEILLMVFVMTCVYSSVNATENLALGKDAFQTDTRLDREAGRAVDENTDGNMAVTASCSHTDTVANTWWKVDLGKIYAIDHVKMYNRVDCCQSRLSHAELYIGLEDGPYKRLGYHASTGASHTFQMPSNVYGRWVKITRVPGRENGHLTLCEVEVMGDEISQESYLRFKYVEGMIGTGEALETTLASSKGACTIQCKIADNCNAFNYNSVTETCVKLESVSATSDFNENNYFYRLATSIHEEVSVD